MVCSMIGLPATLISCLGMFRPTRVPVPPARTTATFRNLVTRGTLSSGEVEAGVSAPHQGVPDPLGAAAQP